MTMFTSLTAPTRSIDINGITYAYRRLGVEQGVPLLFLQHFTGTMDYWDPAIVDGFARAHPVILFDNTGVSRTTGKTPDNVGQMAQDAVVFARGLGLQEVDLLGFSLGGFIAQMIAAEHAQLVRRIILAGTGPQGGEGIANLPHVLSQAQTQRTQHPLLYLFFAQTESSQAAGRAFLQRMAARAQDRDPESSEQTIAAQVRAIVRWGSQPSDGFARLGRIEHPVLIVNGKDDMIVPTINSFVMFEHLPNARLVLYPDSGHGGLYQFSDSFVSDGLRFLAA